MGRKLHIGGQVRAAGWEVLDANAGPHVDHVADARNLERFDDDAFEEIYASHVVEHLDYKDELVTTLMGWRRVLAPGGTLSVSVPDLDVLAGLFLEPSLTLHERFTVMRMIFFRFASLRGISMLRYQVTRGARRLPNPGASLAYDVAGVKSDRVPPGVFACGTICAAMGRLLDHNPALVQQFTGLSEQVQQVTAQSDLCRNHRGLGLRELCLGL